MKKLLLVGMQLFIFKFYKTHLSRSLSTLFIFLFILKANTQNSILAGQFSSSDYHIQYSPDTTVLSGNIPSTVYSYFLDINNDGVLDFEIKLQSSGTALGGDWSYCLIRGINGNKIATSHYDSCWSFGGNYLFNMPIAETFTSGQLIDSSATWDTLSYLSYYSFTNSSHSCGDWVSLPGNFFGLQVVNNPIPVYGWLQVSFFVTSAYNSYLKLCCFACNSDIASNSEALDFFRSIKVYPNPVSDVLMIESVLGSESFEVSICDITGKEIKSVHSAEKNLKLHLDNLNNGIYFLNVRSQSGVVIKKIVVEK